MCALKSRGMSVVCTWGLRGAFSRLVFFLWFPPAHLVCHSPLCKYVPNLPYVYQNSNTPCFLGISTCACVLFVTSSPHHHWPSVIITAHPIHRHHWNQMSVMAKKPPPSESPMHPAMADSNLDLSLLISGGGGGGGGAVVSVPKCTTAQSSVSLSGLSSHHIWIHMLWIRS